MKKQKRKSIHGLKSLIGNTPLLAIELSYKGEKRIIYAKAENLNMTGSIKDRMAFHILLEGYNRGSLKPDAFVAGVGTGGTIMGTGQFLKERHPFITLHPLEPANSPTLSTGYKVGKHRIQGISDEFIPEIVDLEFLDSIVRVDDGDAIIMARKLASELGLGVGISSGANFLGALKIQNEKGKDTVVVTVFPDDNKKYLSTDLLKDEPVKKEFLSQDVKLLNFRGFKRVCYTCCDPIECAENEPLNFEEEGAALPKCTRRL